MCDNYYELWKPVIGFEGIYEVSNQGRIKSLIRNRVNKERFLKGHIDNDGYIKISFNKKKYSLHRIVAISFISNPNNLPCINHKNANKQDNRSENLEWCTASYNTKYSWINNLIPKEKILRGEKHYRTNFTQDNINKIRYLRNQGITCREISEIMGSKRSTISKIVTFASWKPMII